MRFKNSHTLIPLVLVLICTPGAVAQTDALKNKHIVFMVGEREYKTLESLADFADDHLLTQGVQITFITPHPDDPNDFVGTEKIGDADLLVLSVRRRTLNSKDFKDVKRYLDAGKPLIALRTASHAFHHRTNAPPPDHEEWRTFDQDVLGARYEGHFGNDNYPVISRVGDAANPLLRQVQNLPYTSRGSLYRSRDLAGSTQVLLEGTIFENGARQTEPVAWVNQKGHQRIFYTSLGHVSDFEQPAFLTLLSNAIHWAMKINR